MQEQDDARLIDARRLVEAIRAFADARDWAQFHSPKNLAMALTGEVGELVEIFQWLTEDESRRACDDPGRAEQLRHELADVLIYLVRLSDVLGVDLDAAVREKLAVNARKYPVETSRGNNRKHSGDLPD
jgi:NTP pyrophosphatase (non-canonical NTP hydrolase)